MTLFSGAHAAMPTATPTRLLSRPPARISALALLLLSLAGGQALAQPVGPNPQPRRLTPEQQQKLFPDQRRLAIADHRARLAILQRGESCLQKANTSDALRSCMREERDAMRQQRREHMGELQALFERNGLPAPQWKQRLGKPQGVTPQGAGSDI